MNKITITEKHRTITIETDSSEIRFGDLFIQLSLAQTPPAKIELPKEYAKIELLNCEERFIDSIRAYRILTGATLATAKKYVESRRDGVPSSSLPPIVVNTDMPNYEEFRDLCERAGLCFRIAPYYG